MARALLSLGTSEGDKLQNLKTALELIKQNGTIINSSSVYETEAWGFSHSTTFYNMAIELETFFEPLHLLGNLLSIEINMGRSRTNIKGYQSRRIDLDILFYDNLIINAGNLTIPHPKIQERKFVLEPLDEIATNFTHPILKLTVSELKKKCTDSLQVNRLKIILD